MTESMNRILVVTRHSKSVPALLTTARVILASMKGNPYFPSPRPALTAFASAIDELDDAEVAVLSRTRGSRERREEKRRVLLGRLSELKAYVQAVADADPEYAASLIESAGMSVKRRTFRPKPALAVKPGRVSRSVVLMSRSAGDRARYEWQWSTDGGVTWHDAPTTMQAKTEIAGLPVGQRCWFRVRVVTKDGVQNWSQLVSILVT